MNKPTHYLDSTLTTIGLFILIWLSTLYFGSAAAGHWSESSWVQALGYAFKQHWQAGVDYVFTFGPLGYLSHPAACYDADLFYLFLTWQFISGLGFAMIFIWLSRPLPSHIDRFFYFSLIIVVLSAFSYDARYLLGILAATILVISHWSQLRTQPFLRDLSIVALLLSLALVSLTKFSYFMLALVTVFSLSTMVFFLSSRLLAIIIPLTFGAMLMGIWLMAGQTLTNFSVFLQTSLAISNGYSEAMAGGVNFIEIRLALLIMVLIIALIINFAWRKPFKLEHWTIAGLMLFVLFMAWKTGFVRHDSHSVVFFVMATLLPFFIQLAPDDSAIRQWLFYTTRYLTVLLALSGVLFAGQAINYSPRTFIAQWNQHLVDNYKMLTNITRLKQNQDKQVAELKQQYDLPRIRAKVGKATVDIFSWEQGVVFLNGLNWHPRPVFQSHIAYTSNLLAINGNFFAQPTAPEFVIFKLQDIDERFPIAGDSEALKILLRDYQPLLVEKDYLLLTRQPRGQGLVAHGKVLLTQSVKLNESMDLSGLSDKALLLSLDIRQSWLGRIATFLYRLPITRLDLQTTDGEHLSYRIIPQIVQNSFVLNPLILTQADVISWYSQFTLKRVANLRVMVMPTWLHRFFQPEVTITVSEFTVTPPPLDNQTQRKIQRALYPMLQTKPYQVSIPNQDMLEGGQSVLMVHAPGEMRFQVAPGSHTVTGQFGMVTAAYQNNQTCPYPSDGVEFKIVLQQPNLDEVILFDRFLNPKDIKAERGIQTLLPIPFTVTAAPGEATLRLLTQPGPANNAQCDWSFWREIKIE